MEKEFKSQYYQTTKIAKGIYAFIDTYDRKAGSNSGLVDLGDRVIVFDTFYSPSAARDLRKAAEMLSCGRPITVINSHNHIDHIRGNQFFKDCMIISSEACRSTMKDSIQATIDEVTAIPASEIETMRKDIINETDEMKRSAINPILRCIDNMTKEPMVITLPDLTMKDKMVIYGEGRTAELYSFEIGHSMGDTMMFIPEENILFTGDLVFIDVHPWLGDGDCNKLKEICSFINGINANHIIPGHGPIGDNNSVKTLINYIEHMQKTANEALKINAAPEDVLETALVAPYNGWGEKLRALNNLRFFCNKLLN
jgi:Zn-dependent hydrolases, including glyoxylases